MRIKKNQSKSGREKARSIEEKKEKKEEEEEEEEKREWRQSL